MPTCSSCLSPIHPLRLSILPHTTTCHLCSTTQKVAGHIIISGKNTYSEIEIVNQETANRLYKLGARNGGQGVSKGMLCTRK